MRGTVQIFLEIRQLMSSCELELGLGDVRMPHVQGRGGTVRRDLRFTLCFAQHDSIRLCRPLGLKALSLV